MSVNLRQKIVPILGSAALFFLLLWYFSDLDRRSEIIQQVSSVGLGTFLWSILGMFVFILFQAFVLQVSVLPFGKKIPFLEAFGIIVVTFFTNYLIPFMGFGVRGVYLKKKHDLSYKNFTQSLIAILLVEWCVFAAMGLIATLFLVSAGQDISLIITLMLIAIVCGFFVSVCIKSKYIPKILPLSKLAKQLIDDWQGYISSGFGVVRKLFIFTTFEALGFAFAFVVLYAQLFPSVPYGASVVAAALSDLALIIRILPASAGSLEGALQLAMLPYGLTFSDNLSVAFVSRAALAAVFVPLAPFFFWFLLKGKEVSLGKSSD